MARAITGQLHDLPKLRFTPKHEGPSREPPLTLAQVDGVARTNAGVSNREQVTSPQTLHCNHDMLPMARAHLSGPVTRRAGVKERGLRKG